ncbi:hypothetical protein Slin15195_G050610 [Septoria linicola]|uniref:Uncharacterized protein n=1 Tax=Septoria linicola TaxID=215465 RepID=A0A9Q9ALP6_9PEZI|nr:hypothetical protein Slin14017_G054130 [Septoria linicola]USW51742.1 hypothetical protein Slin15195_G050610 [Septoria linicola]
MAMAAGAMLNTRACMLGIPTELRLCIYGLLFRSLVIQVERGPERLHSDHQYKDQTDQDDDSDDEEELDAEGVEEQDRPGRLVDTERGAVTVSRSAPSSSQWRHRTSRGLSKLPGTPYEVAALRLVCKQIACEIGDDWHSQVCYHFPSTTAFIDILSQWSDHQIRSLRRAYVVDTPLPVYAYINPGFYVAHNLNTALCLFPGLQLDTLTVQNIWLEPGGRPIDDWAEFATAGTMKRMLSTQGWKRLEYISGILPLSPVQMKQLGTFVENYKAKKQEPDFRYELGRVRPRGYMRDNLLDRSEGPEDRASTRTAVQQWYADNPKETPLLYESHYLDNVHELQLAMWAERGASADYVEDGAAISSTLESLKDNMTWIELRRTDDYLVDDGVDDPGRHL